ncbi:serine/threonine-protein kinase [Pseudolysobacter antarcticus]|nr:serine/threonine-protein kinase [Pseudolysobacter antarcticus]
MKTQLGHYDLVAELGRGGMGVVYKGYENSLNRYVAIKVLADSLAHDPAVKERFLREARSMAALNDTHIIQIYFIGEDAGQPYIVMEFVQGEALSSVLKREGKLDVEQAAKVIYQTAQGLATAHDRGVIHRDIKPANLMVTQRGGIKIADFGIALVSHDISKKLTTTGEFVGTPGYLSPEVCLAKPVDQRSDIFSLGIVLFEMLTGRMPFTDESPLGLMLEVVRAEIPDVRQLNDQVDADLARVLQKMIAKDPADRYQSCQELIADLGRNPLVANGAPLNLPIKLSDAASSLIGPNTPASGQRPLPSTQPTPYPTGGMPTQITPVPLPRAATPVPVSSAAATVVSPTPVPASAAAPVHASVLTRNATPQRKSSALPWAVAAILILGLCGAAFAFRNQIPALKTLTENIAAMIPGAASNAASTSSTTTSTPAVTVTSTIPAAPTPPAPPVAPPAPVPPATNDVAATTTATAQIGDGDAGLTAATGANNANAPAPAAVADSSSAIAGDGGSSVMVGANGVAVKDGTTSVVIGAQGVSVKDGGDNVTVSTSGVAVIADERRAEHRNEKAEMLARNTPNAPISAPPKPHVPTIAVISGGDSAVAEPAEQIVMASLKRLGFHVIDQAALPRVSHMLRGERPEYARILQTLERVGKVDAVVFVHARPVGSQEMTYYGQSSTLYTAQVAIRAYRVSGNMIGSGWSEKVMFTTLNADDKAREAIEPLMGEVVESLGEFRSRRDRG